MGADENRAIAAVEAFRAVLAAVAAAHSGRLIDATGDAGFLAFESSVDALRAALEVHRELTGTLSSAGGGTPLRARIGLHFGDIVEKDGRLYGDELNIAARLQALAAPGTVCISDSVHRQTNHRVGYRAISLGPRRLKNIAEPVRAYLVLPPGAGRAAYADAIRTAARSHISPRAAVIALAALTLVTGAMFYSQRDTEARGAHYLEYDSFSGVDASDADDYFREGVLLAIVSQLSGLKDLYLVPRSRRIGASLRLEGSVQRQAGGMRIAYRVVRTRDDAQIGGGVVDGAVTELFSLQDRAAAGIVAVLGSVWNFVDTTVTPLPVTRDLTAHDYVLQGQAYLRRPKTGETLRAAEQLFRRASERDPAYAPAHAGICTTLWKQYELDFEPAHARDALAACARAQELAPGAANTLVALGTIHGATDRFDEAREAFERAIRLDPKTDGALLGLAKLYQNYNRTHEAEETFRRAIALQPGHWEPYNWLAAFLLFQGRAEEAVTVLRKVVELTPDNVYGHSNLCSAYIDLGRNEDARAACERSVAISPTSAALANLSVLYRNEREYEKSAAAALRATELVPNDFRLWANRARALRLAGEHSELAAAAWARAGELARIALTVNPNDAEAHITLGLVYAARQEPATATTSIDRAMALEPGNPSLAHGGAVAYLWLGNPAKAADLLRTALELGLAPVLAANDPELGPLRSDPAAASTPSTRIN